MGRYFGTDGFRGEAGRELTALAAYKIGRYLGHRAAATGERGRIVIGKDTRLSSYMLEYALAAGVCASGSDAYLLHVTTTPSVSYITRCDGFSAGVMISASHNPYSDNGIKLVGREGEKLSEDFTDGIEEYIDTEGDPLPTAVGNKIGRTVDYVLGRNRYTGYLISLSRHSYKGLRVGLDAANGAAWMIAKSVFDTLGAKTYVIGDTPSGTNINDGVGSTKIGALSELVRRERLDIGFAFDGDADRCLAVDSRGEVLTGEHILYFMAKYLRTQGELEGNTVVTTVMSNLALSDALAQEGIRTLTSDVGDRFVWELMSESGATLGGEESGHIIFRKMGVTGDGLITAIRIMEALIESKKPSSSLSEGLVLYPQLTRSVRVADKDKALTHPAVIRAREEVEESLRGRGRVLLRKSGTEPVVRIMVECPDRDECKRHVEHIAAAVEGTL